MPEGVGNNGRMRYAASKRRSTDIDLSFLPPGMATAATSPESIGRSTRTHGSSVGLTPNHAHQLIMSQKTRLGSLRKNRQQTVGFETSHMRIDRKLTFSFQSFYIPYFSSWSPHLLVVIIMWCPPPLYNLPYKLIYLARYSHQKHPKTNTCPSYAYPLCQQKSS